MNNMPLYLLSFDIETQDDLIDALITPRSYEKYMSGDNYGKYKPLISDVNVDILEAYRKLCKSLKKKPTVDLLKQTFPNMVFDGVTPIPYDRLEETIKLDISKLSQKDQAFHLLNISNRVSTDGMTSEILDEILSITKVETVDSDYVNILDNLQEIYTKSALEKGISTGVSQIDERTGGLQPGTFNCLAGFAGAGKTTAAVNICYNALKDSKNVCYITLEVPKVDMNYNFLSRHSFEGGFKKMISHSDIKRKELTKDDEKILFESILPDFKEKYGDRLYILDETDFEAYTFRAFEQKIKECDAIATEKTGHGIDLLVIDQAQLLKFGGGVSQAGNETSVINLYVSFFRQQAINFLHSKRPCTVLMLSQINREGFVAAAKNGGKYTLTNLAEANELERASAMVISLFTDESLKVSKQVLVQLLKSRNGETIIDPVISSMDPVYYAFGSNTSAPSSVYAGSQETMFSDAVETLDLGSMVSQSSDNILDNSNLVGRLI